jgi:hypothetical protein
LLCPTRASACALMPTCCCGASTTNSNACNK